jgi:hypothetical protein
MIEWSLLLSFATWRVTSLLYKESPLRFVREWLGMKEDDETDTISYPDNFIGAWWSCFWCLSLVISFIMTGVTFALTDLTIFEAIMTWLASAAGALVLDVRYFARLRG